MELKVKFAEVYNVKMVKKDVFQNLQNSLEKTPKKVAMHATMLTEDFVEMFSTQNPEENINIQTENRLGDTYIKIWNKAKKFNPLEEYEEAISENETDDYSISNIRKMLFQSFGEGVSYNRKAGKNIISIKVHSSVHKSLYLNLGALILAVIIGQLFRMYLPDAVGLFINDNLFVPVKTIFMNMLNLIVVPVVFFSIASCISGFTNLSDLGRIGGKSFVLYVLTSILAIASAVLAFSVFTPSTTGISVDNAASTDVSTVEISLVDTITGIFPSNILSPFSDADMLQLIFLGLIIGVGITLLGEKGKNLANLIDISNELFMKIMGVFIKFMPFATFATVASVVWSLGLGIMISLISLIACFVLAIVFIIIVYALLILIFARKNPLPMFKKVVPVLLTAFSLSSSNATLPTTMETCNNKLGVSPKVSSFSLPLGATLNMDGTCIYSIVSALFLAKVYGLEVTLSMLIPMCGVVLALSLGIPGMPGLALIVISMAVLQLGLPVESIGLIVGIDRLADMLRTTSNVLGDISVTTIVAKSEKLLDDKVYNS